MPKIPARLRFSEDRSQLSPGKLRYVNEQFCSQIISGLSVLGTYEQNKAYRLIENTLKGKTLRDYPLSRMTTFRIGGPADLVVMPSDESDLCAVINILGEHGVRFMPLGAGSNLLFSDEGFKGAIISLSHMKHIEIIENTKSRIKMKMSAGASLPGIIRKFAQFSALRVSRLWGIPGQIGGSIACNAGAMGINLSDLICEIELLDEKCKKIVSKIRDLDYGYRTMRLPHGTIVTSATFSALKGDPKEIEVELESARDKRIASQPRGMSSAGCIFRNPPSSDPAGAIIDRLGFKGRRVGAAGVSEKHANFIVNFGKAKAQDVIRLIDMIRRRVFEEEGIDLELEIKIVESGEPT